MRANLSLTQVERLILSNQYEILAKVDPENQEYYNRLAEIVQRGYEFDYHELAHQIDPDTMKRDDSIFVLDVLDMYRQIQFSYSHLEDKKDISPEDIKFLGFDGNHETELMAYAQFRMDEGDWSIKHYAEGLNSHTPMRSVYKRMLKAWNASADRNKLTAEDIVRIYSA